MTPHAVAVLRRWPRIGVGSRFRTWVACVAMLVAWAGVTAEAAAALVPNDPYYAPYQGYLSTIGAPAAWDYGTGSSSVIVAVLDSGVMTSTPDLAGRLLPGFSTSSYSPDPTAYRHGTWVASVAAMGVNNGKGGAGVGDFSILPVIVSNNTGQNTPYWIAEGIRQSVAAGAKAIVISLDTLTYTPVNDVAVEVADQALVFVAAGNSNARKILTDYSNLVFVSGTLGDGRATWGGGGSSWGPMVDLSAPASSILIADPTIPSGYGLNSGTSFAAPLAAGAAALAWSINPSLTPSQVLSILYSTADDLGDPGWDEVFGHGRVNLAGVAAAAAAGVPEPSAAALALVALAALAWAVGSGKWRVTSGQWSVVDEPLTNH